jgi:hypothetical protein
VFIVGPTLKGPTTSMPARQGPSFQYLSLQGTNLMQSTDPFYFLSKGLTPREMPGSAQGLLQLSLLWPSPGIPWLSDPMGLYATFPQGQFLLHLINRPFAACLISPWMEPPSQHLHLAQLRSLHHPAIQPNRPSHVGPISGRMGPNTTQLPGNQS